MIDVKSIYEPMQKNKIDAFTKKVTKEIKDTIKMKMANNILNKRSWFEIDYVKSYLQSINKLGTFNRNVLDILLK